MSDINSDNGGLLTPLSSVLQHNQGLIYLSCLSDQG